MNGAVPRGMLSELSPDQVAVAPYPHLVVEPALSADLCRTLIDEFPPVEWFTRGRPLGDNVKINRTAVDVLQDAGVSATWKAFIADHLREEFFWDLVRVFRPSLAAEYPKLADSLSAGRTRIGVLRRDGFDRCDILLDAIIGIHTPVRGPAAMERLPHVKGRDRLFVGFVYLRHEDDGATGGDFQFFSARANARPRFGFWRQTPPEGLDLRQSVQYRNNTLVAVLNSSRTIQAISPRGPGTRPYMYMHFLAQMKTTLFDLDYTPAGRLHEFAWRLVDPLK